LNAKRAINKSHEGLASFILSGDWRALAIDGRVDQKTQLLLWIRDDLFLDQLHASGGDRFSRIAGGIHGCTACFFGPHVKAERSLVAWVIRLQVDNGVIFVEWRVVRPNPEIVAALPLHIRDDLSLFIHRKPYRIADTLDALIVFLELDLFDETVKLDRLDIIAGREQAGTRAQQCDRGRDPQANVVFHLLDRTLESYSILLVGELIEVIIDDEREAEAEQEDQIRRENAIAH